MINLSLTQITAKIVVGYYPMQRTEKKIIKFVMAKMAKVARLFATFAKIATTKNIIALCDRLKYKDFR